MLGFVEKMELILLLQMKAASQWQLLNSVLEMIQDACAWKRMGSLWCAVLLIHKENGVDMSS